MTQKCKCEKKLFLLKTYYYRVRTQDGQDNANFTNFVTNPTSGSRSVIRFILDKNYNPVKNEFIQISLIIIPPNNPNSGIEKQTFQQTIMIKTKSGFLSANTFYFDPSSSSFFTIPIIEQNITASSGDLKNAVKVTIETDNDGTIFSNGIKYARRIKIYGCACK